MYNSVKHLTLFAFKEPLLVDLVFLFGQEFVVLLCVVENAKYSGIRVYRSRDITVRRLYRSKCQEPNQLCEVLSCHGYCLQYFPCRWEWVDWPLSQFVKLSVICAESHPHFVSLWDPDCTILLPLVLSPTLLWLLARLG